MIVKKCIACFIMISLIMQHGAFAQDIVQDTNRVIRVFSVRNVKAVNSKYGDSSPVLYENGIVFNTTRPLSMVNYGENKLAENSHMSILLAEFKNKNGAQVIKKPKLLSINLDQSDYNWTICFDKEFKTCFYTGLDFQKKDGAKKKPQLYTSVRKGKGWDKSTKLSFCKEENAYLHPSISEDGNTLYFSSDMPGGRGRSDIYKVEKKGGIWGTPINLGDQINTSYNEAFPYISKDGELYFSSNRDERFGDLDIFSSIKVDGKWQYPLNLGTTINTVYDDFGIHFNEDGKSGYFSSNGLGYQGTDNIYRFEIKKEAGLKESFDAGKLIFEGGIPNYPSGIEVSLLDENSERISTTIIDEEASFLFGLSVDEIYDRLEDPEEITYGEMDGVPDISGNFDYTSLPLEYPEDVMLYLVNESGDTITSATIDENGDFVLRGLPVDHNYIILMSAEDKERMKGMPLQLIDEDGSELSFMEDEETGEFIHTKLPIKYPADVEIYLIDDSGDTIASSIIDENGDFIFTDLPGHGNYMIKMNADDMAKMEGIALRLLDEKGREIAVIEEFDDDGFELNTLLYKLYDGLSLMNQEDNSMMVKSADNKVQGEFDYLNLPLEYSEGMNVYLIAENGDTISRTTTDVYGDFVFQDLPNDVNYLIAIEQEPDVFDQITKMAENKIKNSKKTFHMRSINYAFDQFELDKDGIGVLEKMTTLMEEFPHLNLEVHSHTDAVGSNKYNMSLSKKRANWIIDYLVTKGIDGQRCVAFKHGEKQLLNTCKDGVLCPDFIHAENRRTEFKVTGEGIGEINIIFRRALRWENKTHVVAEGEDLNYIAMRYDIPLVMLKFKNNIDNSVIHKGDVLIVD